MGGNTTKESSKTVENRDPWGPAQPYLLTGLDQASQIYGKSLTRNDPGYTGDFVAQPNRMQTDGAAGLMNLGYTELPKSAADSLATGADLTGKGTLGVTDAMSGLAQFGNSNFTGQNISAAGQYANNPYMDQMVQAATRDATRTFGESVMPGIGMNAAATGNINSTRTGVAEGIAQRGLQDTIADTSAQMRGSAWTQGLAASQADQASRLQALNSYGALGNSLLGAGASQYQIGWDGMSKAGDIFNLGNALTTANNQAPLDNGMAAADYRDKQPWSQLMNYYQIASNAAGQGGVTTTTGNKTTTQQASPLTMVGSLMGAFGNLAKCDVRTKNILGRVGALDNGVPLYVFTYLDDAHAQVHFGPIAQELESALPEAVVEVGGIKHVDTSVLLSSLREAA